MYMARPGPGFALNMLVRIALQYPHPPASLAGLTNQDIAFSLQAALRGYENPDSTAR